MFRMMKVSAVLVTAWTVCGFGHALATPTVLEPDEIANEPMVAHYEQGDINQKVWVVDSRPAGKYIAGHIPGASSLPLDVLKKDFANAEKLAIPKTGKVVFYCAGRECTLSIESADIFRKNGYADAWVYRNGVPGWNQKAQPLQAEAAFVQKGNLILIDTAPGQPTLVTPGNQTLQLSLADLKSDKAKQWLAPLSRNAPVVVLSRGSMEVVNAALEELRDLDFRRIAYFPLSAWTAPLAPAPVLTSLHWEPVYAPGQISPKAFEQAVAAGQFILDVRPQADFARGHFKGAVNLPIEDLERDYAKLPKDVSIFVNCATGAKSQKTYDILGRKGYSNVAFLDAEISCKGEVCNIKE